MQTRQALQVGSDVAFLLKFGSEIHSVVPGQAKSVRTGYLVAEAAVLIAEVAAMLVAGHLESEDNENLGYR